MTETIEWHPTADKPEGFAPILVHIPSEDPFPTVREAYYVPEGEMWIVAHVMVGGIVKESDIALWAYMPKGKSNQES